MTGRWSTLATIFIAWAVALGGVTCPVAAEDDELQFEQVLALKDLGEGETLKRPMSVVVDGLGRVIVNDLSDKVHAWSLDGQHLFNFGEKGTKEGQFMYPQGIAVGPDGSVYVVDGLNFRVEIFDPKGEYSDKFGKQGDTQGTFSRPKGIAIDAAEQVFVADGLLNLVQVVDNVGEYLGKIGGDSETALFAQPYGIWVDKQGRVYVSDRGNDEIKVFAPKKKKK